MSVSRLPIAFAVNIDRIAFAHSPSDRLCLSVTLIQDSLGPFFFYSVMYLRINVRRILDFDDINLCHAFLPFSSKQLDSVTLDPQDDALKCFLFV